jgi:hypothetical protein
MLEMVGMEIQIQVFPIRSLSVERFWEPAKALPQKITIGHNLNIVNVTRVSDDSLEIAYTFTLNFQPNIASFAIKGNAMIKGASHKVHELWEMREKGKPLPHPIIQRVLNTCMVKTAVLSDILGLPFPLPLPRIGPTPSGVSPSKTEYIQ